MRSPTRTAKVQAWRPDRRIVGLFPDAPALTPNPAASRIGQDRDVRPLGAPHYIFPSVSRSPAETRSSFPSRSCHKDARIRAPLGYAGEDCSKAAPWWAE